MTNLSNVSVSPECVNFPTTRPLLLNVPGVVAVTGPATISARRTSSSVGPIVASQGSAWIDKMHWLAEQLSGGLGLGSLCHDVPKSVLIEMPIALGRVWKKAPIESAYSPE